MKKKVSIVEVRTMLKKRVEERKEDIKKMAKNEKKANVRVRLLGVQMFLEGKRLVKIAEALSVAYRTVKEWVERFIEDGVEGLRDASGRGKKQLFPKDKQEELANEIEKMREEKQGGRLTVKEIQERIETKWQVIYGIHGVYQLLKKCRIVWITARSKHPKSDPQAQEEFKKEFPNIVQKALPSHVKMENIDIMFGDQSRVGQQGSLTRTWAKKGTRPRVVKQQEFLSLYVFGAVCPKENYGASVILPYFNTEGMNIFLEELSKKIPAGRHCVLVLDNAPVHKSKCLVVPDNITIIFLPPYSPELNPMERAWLYIKQNWLANSFFENYDILLDKCCDAWNLFVSEENRINTLCSYSYTKI